MRKLTRTEDKNSFTYDFQKREFFSTINDFKIADMAYQFQVISKNRYINQSLETLQNNLRKTKQEFEKVPAVLDRLKRLNERKREQNIKVQYLGFMQTQIFEFLAARNNGFLSERP